MIYFTIIAHKALTSENNEKLNSSIEILSHLRVEGNVILYKGANLNEQNSSVRY